LGDGDNPMNRLVPYLDLFVRLGDEELSRLARVDIEIVAALRNQVMAIDGSLAHYGDLLPRLGDDELVRLTGATPKTIRFWRLCQPRTQLAPKGSDTAARGELSAPPLPQRAAAGRPTRQLRAGPQSIFNRTMIAPASSLSPNESADRPEPEPAVDPIQSQQRASRFMTFSGDPFPGFDDSSANHYLPFDDGVAFDDDPQ
jgi:hypothetical protein